MQGNGQARIQVIWSAVKKMLQNADSKWNAVKPKIPSLLSFAKHFCVRVQAVIFYAGECSSV
jgi:hypothetical protein